MTTLEPSGATPFAPAEDRATLGSDPSAGWSPANGRSGGLYLKAVRLAPAGAGTKAINPSVFYPARLHSRLPSAAKIIIPWTGDIIVVNHWQPCLAPTVPLVTLYNSLDFPASIATGYRARSQLWLLSSRTWRANSEAVKPWDSDGDTQSAMSASTTQRMRVLFRSIRPTLVLRPTTGPVGLRACYRR